MLKTLLGKEKDALPKVQNTDASIETKAAGSVLDAQNSTSSTINPVNATSSVNGLHNNLGNEVQPGVYNGDPENQVIVFDIDETLVCGDIYKKDLTNEKIRKQVEADGYEVKQTNGGKYYVLRPGTKELLEYLYSRGHRMVLVSRDLAPYVHDLYTSDPVLKQFCSGALSHGDLISKMNQNYEKYPDHPDNLSFWGRTKNFFHAVFVRCPRYCWKKFCSIFSKKPVWLEEGRGVAGKYPPNINDLLVNAGNNSLKDFPASHILVDNYAEAKLVGDKDPTKIENYKYWGREVEDSKHSRDFAVVTPNVPRKPGEQPKAFLADGEELKDDQGRYVWVKNVIAQIEKGWKQQFKDSTGMEPKTEKTS